MMLDDFVWRATAAGIGVALVAGPLGCYVVWQRMVYFGATLAHAALLGIALGIVLGIHLQLGIFAIAVLTSVALVVLERRVQITTDTLLGIIAHSALALGLIVISLAGPLGIDLVGYLFGDILSVTRADLAWIGGACVVTLLLLALSWRRLLLIAVHPDLARVDGVRVEQLRLLLLLLLSLVVAVAMQIVGLLLVVSLLLLPASTARRFTRTPEAMAAGAIIAGVLSVVLGLQASLVFDLPAGPAIVLAATVLFVAALGVGRRAV